jgi:hypothetical protein
MERGALRWGRWRYAVGGLVCLVFGWFAFVRGTGVPLLGLVDLGFHELGHLVTYPFPDMVTAMMGSVAQVAVPLGIALYFLLIRREPLGGALCLAWAATSAGSVSTYIADAPRQSLPLLGEGIHDWAFVLGRLHALDRASAIAVSVKAFGLVLLFAGFAICVWHLLLEEQPPAFESLVEGRSPPVDRASR